MNFGVLPLRAIAFQILFLMMAIALESVVLFRLLNFDYRTSVRYAATLNIFSTVVGWLVFFNVQAVLPEALRAQLISYFFFERFFPNPWSASVAPLLAISGLGIFFGVFLLELKGLDLLDIILEKNQPIEASALKEEMRGFRRLQGQGMGVAFRTNSRTSAILVANAVSFSAILFMLFIRWLEQSTR